MNNVTNLSVQSSFQHNETNTVSASLPVNCHSSSYWINRYKTSSATAKSTVHPSCLVGVLCDILVVVKSPYAIPY